MQRRVRAISAGAAGDSVRAAEIIVRVAKRDDVPSNLLLGATAADMALEYSRLQLDQAQRWQQVTRSADFSEPYRPNFRPMRPRCRPEIARPGGKPAGW